MRSLFVVAVMTLAAGSLEAIPLLTLEPVSQSVGAGSTAEVQVSISGLGAQGAPSLGAFDINLQFDPTVLAFSGVSFGDPTLGDQLNLSGTGAISDTIEQAAGAVEFFEVSLDSATVLNAQQADHFVLATLQLKAIKSGITLLVPSVQSASDADGHALSVAVQNARLEVTAVPEPSVLGMLSLGAAFVAWGVRRRRLP